MSQGLFQNYAADLLQAFVALVAVCLLALLFLKISSRHSFRLGATHGAVRVVQRIVLEPRRTLYLVQAGSRVLLIGVSEAGGPRLIAELSPDILAEIDSKPPSTGNPFQKLQRLVLPRRENAQEVRPHQDKEKAER